MVFSVLAVGQKIVKRGKGKAFRLRSMSLLGWNLAALVVILRRVDGV
jgi:hypothetical protein